MNSLVDTRKYNHQPKVLLASMSGSCGGMELRMQQDAVLLRQHDWLPIISTPKFPESPLWSRYLEEAKIKTITIPYPYLFEDWRTRHLQKLKGLTLSIPMLQRKQFDMAHIFLCWTTYGLGMLWAVAKLKIPAMVSVHNAFPHTTLPAWHKAHLIEAFSTTRRIVAVSPSALEKFLNIFSKFLPRSAVSQVISNPIDIERFRPRPEFRMLSRERLGLPSDAKVIGSVGRLDKQKQPWKLLDTLSELHHSGVPAYLVLIGRGELETSLRNQARKLGLENYVLFAGYVNDVENLFPALDLHLLLSKNEGFGIVTAEAMAAGIPVMGSDVPGTRDVLMGMKGGILLKSTNTRSIAKQILELFNDDTLRHEMAIAGPKEVSSRFGSKQIEIEMFRTYETILNGHTRTC